MLENIHVMSLSPGRVRLKVCGLKKSNAFATTLCERIAVLPGIEKVEVNQTTCSLLVLYDKHLFATDKSAAALQQALAGQLSPEELERLRSALRSKESMETWQQALAGLLSPSEQNRLHSILQALVASL